MSLHIRRDVFQAIADPTRRDIISLVARKPLNLNTIADNFNVSRPAVSQHIKILTECGLILIRKKGRERVCEVQLEQLSEVADWMEPLRQLWEHRFEKLDDLLSEIKADKETPK